MIIIIDPEQTGIWEREANGQFRHLEMTVIEDNAEAIRNGTFWFVPLPNTGNHEDEVHPVGRRPPSPAHHPSLQPIPSVSNKSLKDIIHNIIMDCKDLGAIDLNWIQDYP